jgi:hypothetical protein
MSLPLCNLRSRIGMRYLFHSRGYVVLFSCASPSPSWDSEHWQIFFLLSVGYIAVHPISSWAWVGVIKYYHFVLDSFTRDCICPTCNPHCWLPTYPSMGFWARINTLCVSLVWWHAKPCSPCSPWFTVYITSSEQAQFFFTTIRSNIWLTAAQLSPSFPLSISLISSTTVPSETASPFLLH